jgi:hypothetical protein
MAAGFPWPALWTGRARDGRDVVELTTGSFSADGLSGLFSFL